MRFIKAKIVRSPIDQPVIDVLPSEIPVLEVIYGPENVQVYHDIEGDDRDIEDPVEEFQRLVDKYGAVSGGDMSYASLAYGLGQKGIDEMQKIVDKEGSKKVTGPANTGKTRTKDKHTKDAFVQAVARPPSDASGRSAKLIPKPEKALTAAQKKAAAASLAD